MQAAEEASDPRWWGKTFLPSSVPMIGVYDHFPGLAFLCLSITIEYLWGRSSSAFCVCLLVCELKEGFGDQKIGEEWNLRGLLENEIVHGQCHPRGRRTRHLSHSKDSGFETSKYFVLRQNVERGGFRRIGLLF